LSVVNENTINESKMNNTVWHHATVNRELRNQQNRHKSIILWFTGLSGSGKSTIAHAVEEQLFKQGFRTFVLDGDNVRHGLSSNLGFSEEDRKENIRRVGETAKLMLEAGIITLTAFISPYRQDRERIKIMMPPGDFIEIYCEATLETCERRDVKGYYKKARAGIINNYTGIDSPYEIPDNPELTLNTDNQTLEESVQAVLALLKQKVIL
jgi:adenylylsulfate kinase